MTKPDQELGRRERNKLEKQTRIFDAAAELFAEKGYSAVTTQEIADRADVAGGTLFRYAASKAELLLMVYNAEYRKQIELGEEREAKSTGTEDRVLELVSPPLLIASRRNDENTGIYQREVLFGEPSECFRAEGLELSQRLQTRIAQILHEAHPNHTTRTTTAARTISNVLHFEIARAALDRITADELTNIVAAQVRLTLAGLPTE